MREIKTIRGLRRRKSNVDKWIQSSLTFDLERLKDRQVYYQKIYVYPWSNLFCSQQPPTGYRNQITSGLIDIYLKWRLELEKLGQPYYLKIWLNDPRFMDSQVVAAIGDKIEYYSNLFQPADMKVKFPSDKFIEAKDKLGALTWTPFLDEDTYFESEFSSGKENYETIDDYNFDQRLIASVRKNHDRQFKVKTGDTEDVCYCKTRGLVWCSS